MKYKLRMFNLILIVLFVFSFTACTITKAAIEPTVTVITMPETIASEATTTVTTIPRTAASEATTKYKIAFTSGRDGKLETYIMNVDGSEQTRLTDNSAVDRFNAISPDGSKTVFMSLRDGNSEIYIMNVDGTESARLTNNPAVDGFPTFSPDGAKIAYVSYRDGNFKIYIMNIDGSEQTRLTDSSTDESRPSFSPDGVKIAFMSYYDGNAEICLVNVDGSEQTRLTNNPAYDSAPSFSPDGSKIAFVSTRDGNAEIYIMNIDGSKQTRLTDNPAVEWDPSFLLIPETTVESGIENGEYNIGDTGPAGGLIFYVNPDYITDGWRYLEAAPVDQSEVMQWYNGSNVAMDVTATAVGTGKANTQTIIKAQGEGNYAAQLCNDLTLSDYSDWFLPSRSELNKMYINLYLKGLGGFTSGNYWSSSESDARGAWFQGFGKGYYLGGEIKGSAVGRVRAVRAF